MNNVPDRQNKDGLKSYRRRLRNRALGLVGDREFRDALREFRTFWNREAPRYTIAVVSTLEEFERSPLIYRGPSGYAPQRWVDDLPELMLQLPNWNGMVGELLEMFFPAELYGDSRHSATEFLWDHPALPFVSASIFCPPNELADNIDAFIDVSQIQPQSLPYPPSSTDKMEISCLRGEVQFWRYLALDTIGEEMTVEEWRELLNRARRAGLSYAEDQGISFGLEVPDDQRWWYLPLPPITTANDVRDAAPAIAEKVREVYGAQRIDDMVRSLRHQGLSQSQIAKELGVGLDLVRSALLNGEDAS